MARTLKQIDADMDKYREQKEVLIIKLRALARERDEVAEREARRAQVKPGTQEIGL